MFGVFINAWKIADLRRKILFTIFIIIIFRLGSHIFIPFISPGAMEDLMGLGEGAGTLMAFFNSITGGGLGRGALFAMSITPYINASIITQLLTVAIPALERMQKEGEEGQKKINRIVKFLALGIGLFQATAFYFALAGAPPTNGVPVLTHTTGIGGVLAMITIIGCFTAGASLIIWLGEQITDKGIGNGISMILFAGIISSIPSEIYTLVQQLTVGATAGERALNAIFVPLTLLIYIAMIGFVVLMTNAERRIPVQYAKRQVGRKMYGGQSSHIPIKVAMSGVMPIIFAMSIMSLPQTILHFFGITGESGLMADSSAADRFWGAFLRAFNMQTWIYAFFYFILIIGFNYFYVAVQYNPVEIANNLKKNNGAIPGYRPGKPTSDFINNSLSKITFIGAIFLGIIAVFPIAFTKITGYIGANGGQGIIGLSLGGTTILIVVGVALETMRTLESQMMMRHHKGFLE
ncbi:MAG: preprotein translocase subunit SecY [Oscillospiraceae bacterium]|nr:preprotein translocase subunit SecY [Oscillospiraceae bacterium]